MVMLFSRDSFALCLWWLQCPSSGSQVLEVHAVHRPAEAGRRQVLWYWKSKGECYSTLAKLSFGEDSLDRVAEMTTRSGVEEEAFQVYSVKVGSHCQPQSRIGQAFRRRSYF